MKAQGRNKRVWCVTATFEQDGVLLEAPVVVRGWRGELEEIMRDHALREGLTLLSLDAPVPPADMTVDAHRLMTGTLSEAQCLIGPRALADVASCQDTRALQVHHLSDRPPLDGESGVTDALTVSPAHAKLVFGQPEPAATLGSFALIDANRVPALPERLAASGLEHTCLYQGDALETHGDTAPWLLRLEEGNSFVRSLFTHDPKDEMGATLWGADAFVFLRSPVSLTGLKKHFRKFLQVHDPETDTRVFFRFYAPETLRTLVAHMAQADLQELFAGCALVGAAAGQDKLTVFSRENVGLVD